MFGCYKVNSYSSTSYGRLQSKCFVRSTLECVYFYIYYIHTVIKLNHLRRSEDHQRLGCRAGQPDPFHHGRDGEIRTPYSIVALGGVELFIVTSELAILSVRLCNTKPNLDQDRRSMYVLLLLRLCRTTVLRMHGSDHRS